jgi:16S rRNA G1207 methylase RsmC
VVRKRDDADPLLRGRLSLRQHGVGVQLVTGEGVFSAAAVDPGTTFLLRWLADVPGRRVLDMGCGYGPLALWLAAADPEREVLAVDRDALAVECTAAGATLNGLAERVTVRGSLGYDDLDADARFDLVVSNVPAKVGTAALRHLLLDAWHRLAPGGQVAIVVVERLAAEVAALLEGDDVVEVEHHRANRSYATWRYRLLGPPAGADAAPAFERGVYRRGVDAFAVGATTWEAATSYSISEFDTLDHATEAAVALLRSRPLDGPVAVLGCGQGHVALAVRASSGPATALRLVDRDLLALRTAGANLDGAVDLRHVARPAGSVAGCAAAVVALPPKQPVAVTAALLAPALRELPAGAPTLLHGRAADVARVVDLLGSAGLRLAMVERRAVRGGVAAFTVTPPP